MTFVSRGGLGGSIWNGSHLLIWFLNLQITNPEEIKVRVHEANARIEIGTCDYTSVLMDYLRNGLPPHPNPGIKHLFNMSTTALCSRDAFNE